LADFFPGLFEKVVCEHNAAKMKKSGKTDCIKFFYFLYIFSEKNLEAFFFDIQI